jgi:branched-chain amino acid transport system substrate-binding protein
LLVQELGDEARGIGISQVMPYPWNDTTPLVNEYQKLLGQTWKIRPTTASKRTPWRKC